MEPLNPIRPPRWAERLLEWYCRPELLEDLQGDLHEYFERNVKARGPRRARLIYIIDVCKFFRLYTIRKPEFVNLFINWIMLGSYIKTSGRSLVRNKLFSTINMAGLAISMSVGLIMISVLHDVFQYDRFHTHYDRIERVISRYEYLGEKDNSFMATTSMKAGQLIQENFKQPEAIAIFHRGFDDDVSLGEKTIPLRGFYGNSDVFKVFSFRLISGNPETALSEPFSVVLTEKSAQKIFGDEEALGKTVRIGADRDYTVTGVVEDPPVFSHIKFDMLGSLSTRTITVVDQKSEMNWDNVWSTWVYLLFPEGFDKSAFKQGLADMAKREDPSVKNTHIELELQPLREIMLTDSMGNQIGATLGTTVLWIFGGLALVVILSACFNYTNLSIARSLRRTREVGIRKVVGAARGQVMSQFVVEAVILSLGSLVLAFLLVLLLKPYFLSIEPDLQRILVLDLSPAVVGWFILFAIGVGIMAGFFPALFFARINAVQVLKNMSSVPVFRKLTLRRTLIVFQYFISILFITSTIVVYKQYRHFVSFDLGFSTANIYNISVQGNKAELLKKELRELPEVKGISESMMITSVGNYYGTNMKYPPHPDDSAGVSFNTVDEYYMPLHQHHLLAGRNFMPKPDSAVESEVIVNEQVLHRFNIAGQDPQKAIGELLRVDGKEMVIIGVMKNFQYGRANDKAGQREVVFRYGSGNPDQLNLLIESTDILATRQKLEAIWKKIDQVHPFEGQWYTEQLAEAFSGLQAAVKVAAFLAFLAICIASMGLLGMVVFTTETRLKEISIRKVLGASVGRLLFLLSRGFLGLLGVAIIIALPVTILFFEQIAFPELANHAPIPFAEMLLGVLGVLMIALIMILSQTFRVATTNPAEVLKNE
jgi:ABC-type antimicrobial peptide transport system permease subunit